MDWSLENLDLSLTFSNPPNPEYQTPKRSDNAYKISEIIAETMVLPLIHNVCLTNQLKWNFIR